MGEYDHQKDPGAVPFVTDMTVRACRNRNFRETVWTGNHLQLTVMEIPLCGEVGAELHPDTDQLIRVEAGQALVLMGECREKMDFRRRLGPGEAALIPCGTWHNIVNDGRRPLKLSSVYAPPHHPQCTIHRTREEAEE